MLNDMLSHIVAILIHNERRGTCMKFLEDSRSSRLFTVFEHPLNDSAAIGVSRQNLHLTSEGVDNELDVLSGYSFNGFLDYVVAILVLDAFQHIVFELFDQLSLLIGKDMFESLPTSAQLQKIRLQEY